MDKHWQVGLTGEGVVRVKAEMVSYGLHGELELLDDSEDVVAVFAPTRWDYAKLEQS